MTATEALRLIQTADSSHVFVDADVLNFAGESKESVVDSLHSARSCDGDGRVFVVDGHMTVIIEGFVYVIGVRR